MKLLKKILLGVAGFILFLLLLPLILLVSFAPLKYAVVARVGDGTVIRAKASYLFGILTVRYLHQKGESTSLIRFFGKRLGGKHKKTVKNTPPPEKLENNEKSIQPEQTEKPTDSATPPPADKASGKSKAQSILTYPELKIIIKLVLQHMKKFVRTLFPKRLDISGTLGFDDPSATGMFMGVYESVTAMLGLRERIRLAPDFAEPGVKLRIALSGRLSMARLARPLLGLLVKKPVRRFITFLRKQQ